MEKKRLGTEAHFLSQTILIYHVYDIHTPKQPIAHDAGAEKTEASCRSALLSRMKHHTTWKHSRTCTSVCLSHLITSQSSSHTFLAFSVLPASARGRLDQSIGVPSLPLPSRCGSEQVGFHTLTTLIPHMMRMMRENRASPPLLVVEKPGQSSGNDARRLSFSHHIASYSLSRSPTLFPISDFDKSITPFLFIYLAEYHSGACLAGGFCLQCAPAKERMDERAGSRAVGRMTGTEGGRVGAG